MRASRWSSAAFVLCACNIALAAAPQPQFQPLSREEVQRRCGAPPPAEAEWMFLGAPPRGPHQRAALLATDALLAAFANQLPRDIACIRVQILGDDGLSRRYGQVGRRTSKGPPIGLAGFHTPTLGADSTVYVTPQTHIPLEAVITHEVLHALSHRFSMEAQRRRLSHMVEGTTDWITRELAEASLGIPKRDYHTAYDGYVRFFDALVGRLGRDGHAILIDSYFRTGYYQLESEVDGALGVSLRESARALEEDDLGAAMEGIGIGSGRRRR